MAAAVSLTHVYSTYLLGVKQSSFCCRIWCTMCITI